MRGKWSKHDLFRFISSYFIARTPQLLCFPIRYNIQEFSYTVFLVLWFFLVYILLCSKFDWQYFHRQTIRYGNIVICVKQLSCWSRSIKQVRIKALKVCCVLYLHIFDVVYRQNVQHQFSPNYWHPCNKEIWCNRLTNTKWNTTIICAHPIAQCMISTHKKYSKFISSQP